MARFIVHVTEHVQRSAAYAVKINKQEVVAALGLEGDNAKEWRDHIQDYVQDNWTELQEHAERDGVADEDEFQVDVDHVEEAD